jgi:hypothetical protein
MRSGLQIPAQHGRGTPHRQHETTVFGELPQIFLWNTKPGLRFALSGEALAIQAADFLELP